MLFLLSTSRQSGKRTGRQNLEYHEMQSPATNTSFDSPFSPHQRTLVPQTKQRFGDFCPTPKWGCQSPCWHPPRLSAGIGAQLANGAGQISPWRSLIKVNDVTPGRNLAHCPEPESTTSPAGNSQAAQRQREGSLAPGAALGTVFGICEWETDSINAALSKPGP